MLSALAGVLLGALAVQFGALSAMGARRPIGDEIKYLLRGGAEDPHAPQLFLRAPFYPWWAAVCHRGGRGAAERRLRGSMSVASWLTVAVTAIAGWRLGGGPVAVVAASLVAVQPERILLGCHLWPDTVLALILASLAAVQTLPASPALALAAGGLCTLGVLVRIDFLAALPFVLAAWWQPQGALSAAAGGALLAPPLLALALVAARNGRRYGIPLPDTTWAFNLTLARSEARRDQGRYAVQPAVHDAFLAWTGRPQSEGVRQGLEAFLEILRSPWRLGRGMARRLLALVGPDTFIRQQLLPRDAAYPDLSDRWRRRWDAALQVAFPLLVVVVLVTAAAGLSFPASFAWPSLGLMLPAVLFHARTRYRLAAMPALGLVAAQNLVLVGGQPPDRPLFAAAILGIGAVLFWALLRIRCSAELP